MLRRERVKFLLLKNVLIQWNKNRNRFELICPQCKKSFYVSRSRKDKRKYCSKECQYQSRKGMSFPRKDWGGNGTYERTEEMRRKASEVALRGYANGRVNPNKGKRMSEEQRKKISENNAHWWKGKKKSEEYRRNMGKNRKGANNPAWKGGVTPRHSKIRESLDYTLWREKVFKRDDFTCQKYKTKGGKLRAHHISNFSEFPELRFVVDNGITLSNIAHKEFHGMYGVKNNTREQLEEFLLN